MLIRGRENALIFELPLVLSLTHTYLVFLRARFWRRRAARRRGREANGIAAEQGCLGRRVGQNATRLVGAADEKNTA